MTDKFQALVKEVKEKKLKAAAPEGELELKIDAWIKNRQAAFVLNGEGAYYIWYAKGDGCWVRLSWSQVRRDLPAVWGTGPRYNRHEKLVLERLEKAGRIFRTATLKEVVFE